MTNEQILRKAISKAIKNGLEDIPENWEEVFDIPEFFKLSMWAGIIFSHDFAKAFWGEEIIPEYFIKMTQWQYHLQKMVLEKEPLKYIEKFL